MKKLLILPTVLLLGACDPGALAAFTAVGAGGAYINHKEKGDVLTGDETVDGITDGFKRDKFVGHKVNE